MKKVKDILEVIKENGFHGTFPLYIKEKGHWHDSYALFELEFEQNDDVLALDLCDEIEDDIGEGVEVSLRDNEFEVIGGDFDEVVADKFWEFPLIDDIW